MGGFVSGMKQKSTCPHAHNELHKQHAIERAVEVELSVV
jgi:hypothetical protein